MKETPRKIALTQSGRATSDQLPAQSRNDAHAHHAVLLFAMLLIHVMLVIEAHRYRFYRVYRGPVRMFESLYLANVPAYDGKSKRVELDALARDLRVPRFTITITEAMSRRLRRKLLLDFPRRSARVAGEDHVAPRRREDAARAFARRIPRQHVDRGNSGRRRAAGSCGDVRVARLRHAALQPRRGQPRAGVCARLSAASGMRPTTRMTRAGPPHVEKAVREHCRYD